MSPIPERTGLQPERTALAWQRTSVTALTVLVPVVLVALRIDQPVLAGAGAVALVASTAVVASVRRRLRELGDDDRGYSPFPPMVLVAVVSVLGGIGGAAVGLALHLQQAAPR